MILHIPHASTRMIQGVQITNVEENHNRLCDLFTDELFQHSAYEKIIFPYSRFCCDVERFKTGEPMEKFGMGFTYTKDTFGNPIINSNKKFAGELYDQHHLKLTNAVNRLLSYFPFVTVVDCHSFPDEQLSFIEDSARPDICIGTDSFHTPVELIGLIKKHFENHNFNVMINRPFAGCLIPQYFYNKNPNVKGIMIEINRKLYLNDKFKPNENFNNIQKILTEALELIWHWEFDADVSIRKK